MCFSTSCRDFALSMCAVQMTRYWITTNSPCPRSSHLLFLYACVSLSKWEWLSVGKFGVEFWSFCIKNFARSNTRVPTLADYLRQYIEIQWSNNKTLSSAGITGSALALTFISPRFAASMKMLAIMFHQRAQRHSRGAAASTPGCFLKQKVVLVRNKHSGWPWLALTNQVTPNFVCLY